MKVVKSSPATEQDIAYITDDLAELFDVFTDNLNNVRKNASKNIETQNISINADFDGLQRAENNKHNKKWRGAKIALGVTGVAGLVGLLAAGAITGNESFFSTGNLIVGGLSAIFGMGLGNYLAAFDPKHQEKHNQIEQERKSRLENVPFSEQSLHDQKEIEINKRWLDAISNQVPMGKLDPKNALAYLTEKLEEKSL